MSDLPLTEMCGSHEIFAASLARVERIGSCARMVFAVPQRVHDNVIENVIVLKLIVPAEALSTIAEAMISDAPQLDGLSGARLRVVQ